MLATGCCWLQQHLWQHKTCMLALQVCQHDSTYCGSSWAAVQLSQATL
jgi:hypothetical protein